MALALPLFGIAAAAWAQESVFGVRGTPTTLVTPTSSPSRTPMAFSAKDVRIVTAVWGSDIKFVEVTGRLDEVLSHPDQEFEVGVDWLHADPAPGWKKVLLTIFEVNGTRYVMGNHEGIKLSLRKFQDFVDAHPPAKKP